MKIEKFKSQCGRKSIKEMSIATMNEVIDCIFTDIFNNRPGCSMEDYTYELYEALDDLRIYGPRRTIIHSMIDIISQYEPTEYERIEIDIERFLLATYRSAQDEESRLLGMEYYNLLFEDEFPIWGFEDYTPPQTLVVAAPAA